MFLISPQSVNASNLTSHYVLQDFLGASVWWQTLRETGYHYLGRFILSGPKRASRFGLDPSEKELVA
jgi:hypothetical protein